MHKMIHTLRDNAKMENIIHKEYVTGSEKTQLSELFYISRNTTFKYSSHSGSLMPNCRDAKFTA